MRKIIGYVSVVFMLACSASTLADQPRRFTIDNTFYHSLKAQQTGRIHELIVSLPHSYQSDPDKYYPVLYYLDAHWDTPLLNSVYNALAYDRVTPEFIMVGLSYAGDNIDYGPDRLRDMTPSQLAHNKVAGHSGGASEFLTFIKGSVVPLVESTYRVDPKQRVLAGSSLGGLFTLYAMYQQPAYFGRYIAISPAVYWDNNYIAALDKAYAKNHKALNARLFLSYGTEEYQPFRQPIAQFQKQLAERDYQGLSLRNYRMEGLRHAGVKPEGYTHGLIWVWQDLAPKGPSGLENEFRQSR